MDTAHGQESTFMEFEQEIEIAASPEKVFEGMLHRLSEGHKGNADSPLPMELERRPGGRWFRNLGDGQGHLWGFVQSIKAPSLLELYGPMFMSYPVSGHLIIRFFPTEGGTKIAFRYSALGMIQEEHREGVKQGWGQMLAETKKKLES